ncbi:MAG: ABC transporter permease subunit [Gammaproteobacteria bacterium]|nr:ABC transporter permease [Gammaproteobacteria bacterium]NIP89606.1 ABC transporter permease [Gammaproteobacteria bacterium]NIR24518.1 ABC transporter permease [Gammaproteobacteria bacterium]NIS06394.1 ABC transporter permease [Gammaproteobacteria bacterium]NIV48815.1 ABC transporter permease subunit [Gammaproteobacteria bacterium]
MMRLWLPVAILLVWLVAALLGPLVSPAANRIALEQILAAPAAGAWLGHDELGRPVLERLVAGARTSFLVAVSVVALSLVIGTFIGIVSAWLGGLWDHVIVRVTDVFLAFPGILLAIALAGILGPGVENVVIALAAVGWVGFARLARAQALSVKQREHVQAAIALGSRTPRILWWHVLPLVSAPLIVEGTFAVAGVIIAEAGLSFLGLGVQPPAASWGSIIREGTRYMLVAPHLVLGPAAVLLAVVVSVNLLGDRLRDRMDVRGRDAAPSAV